MTEIATISAIVTVPGITQADKARVGEYVAAALSPATVRAYGTDLAAFGAWCRKRGGSVDTASPAIIASWLSELASEGRKASGIARARAALVHHYKACGAGKASNPACGDGVDAVMSGIRRKHGVAPTRKAATTDDKIAVMLSHCPDTLPGKRDRALIALGFMGAFRRSELIALTVEDIAWQIDGALFTIRKSKTDQDGEGQTVGIMDGARLGALSHLRAWLEAAGITSGPIFRSINRHGSVSVSGITGQTVADTVKRYAKAAGLDPATVAGHSLRAGFVTSAAIAGEGAAMIAETSRHKNMNVLLGYVRSANLIKNSAGRSFA